MTDVPALKCSDVRCDPDTDTQYSARLPMEKSGVKTMYAVEKYEIERKGDASYTATWRDQLHRLLPLTTLAAMAANLLYLTFRIRYTIDSQSADHMVYPAAWVFMAIETAMSWGSPASWSYALLFIRALLMKVSYSTGLPLSITSMFPGHTPPPA